MSKKSPAISSKAPAANAAGGEIGRAWPVVASTGAGGAGVTVTPETVTGGPASLSVSAKKAFLASVLMVQFTGTRWKPSR